jgi:hypothetical protein
LVSSDAPQSIATEWRNGNQGKWYCYWDDGDRTPADGDASYVFRPPLRVATFAGAMEVVTPDTELTTDATSPRHVLQCLLDLRRLHSTADAGGRGITWGDESDYQWEPFLMPWRVGEALSAEALLKALGAHREIVARIWYRHVRCEEDDEEETAPEGCRFRSSVASWLARHEAKAVFLAGSDLLNPVPCFAVARVQPGLVAGFVGGVVHT